MAEYTLDDIFEPVFITLDQHRFKMRERTKTLSAKIDALEERREKITDDTSEDEAIGIMIEMLDVLLEPMGDGNNGTRSHAKTVLKKAWEAERIGSDKIVGLANFFLGKMQEQLDPLSHRPTVG